MFATKEIIEQLEHVRKLRFQKSELVWLAGNTFYGRRGIFERAFLEWLEQDLKLSDYVLSVKDGQFHLSFDGYWPETTMWELYALSIFDELRTRANMKKLSEFYLDILYARAKTKLWSKIERLRIMQVLRAIDLRRPVCMLLLLLVVCVCAQDAGNPQQRGTEKPQVLWQKLAAQIGEVDRNLDGVFGATFFLHADDVFPQASSIKIAVLAELYHQGQQSTQGVRNKAKLTDLYAVQSSDLVPDSAIMSGLIIGTARVTNRDLAIMMVAVSDESATNVLIDWLGIENANAEGPATTGAAIQ